MRNLNKYVIAVGVGLLLLVVFAVPKLQPRQEPTEDFSYVASEDMSPEMPPAEIVVHVAGAVTAPGVYTLEEGQRVDDALQLAGIAADADIDALNRAAVLTDGQKLVVPVQGDGSQAAAMAEQADPLISLNQADLQQLMRLPGIGAVKAQSILDYRAQQGGFQTIEEIQQVNGIGSSTFEQIKNKIKI